MDSYFPDAIVTGYEMLAASLDLPDPDDRHVLAAAILGEADVIVTANLRDFPANYLAPHAIATQHPDTFITDLFQFDTEALLEAVHGHRTALSNPPRSVGEYLASLIRLGLNGATALLQAHETAI